MFVLKEIPDVEVDVEIHVPGEAESSTLQARWRLHPWSAFKARVEQIQSGEIDDEHLVEADLLELKGIKDENGEPLAHSPELVAQLMEIGFVRRPLILSWYKAQEGREATAAKN